jgi:hypothetical protein
MSNMTSELKWDRSTMECRRNSFTVDDYVIGILLKLSPEQTYVRISHPEKGELLVSPKSGECVSRISDAAGFYQAPRSSFTFTEMSEAFPLTVMAQNMEDVLWEAAFHAAQGRLIDGLRKFDVVQFTRWPNVTRVSLTPNVMRICALLTRFPSGIYLGQVILGVEEAEMYSVCSAAKVIGIVNMLNRSVKFDEAEVKLAEARVQKADEIKSRQFLSRLFAKLSGL